MPQIIDRTESLAADKVSGITHNDLMKADPVWAQLRGEIAALQALVIAQRANFNALLTKLDADSGDTGGDADYAATLAITTASKPDPSL